MRFSEKFAPVALLFLEFKSLDDAIQEVCKETPITVQPKTMKQLDGDFYDS